MQYVISDIHGCSHTFQHLLKIIGFCEKDLLYVLGDTIDRGTRLGGRSFISNQAHIQAVVYYTIRNPI